MLSAVGAKRLDSFNEALQHKYSVRHALFLARALHPDQELWHTFCQLGVRGGRGVPRIVKIAKYAGAGCLAGADTVGCKKSCTHPLFYTKTHYFQKPI